MLIVEKRSVDIVSASYFVHAIHVMCTHLYILTILQTHFVSCWSCDHLLLSRQSCHPSPIHHFTSGLKLCVSQILPSTHCWCSASIFHRLSLGPVLLCYFLWSPYVIGRPYIFSCCGLFFFFFLFFLPRLISAVGDWMAAILRHIVWS